MGFSSLSAFAQNSFVSALAFDGVTNYVFLGATPLTNPWTAEFWVCRQDAADPSAALLADGVSALKLEQQGTDRRVGFTRYGNGGGVYSFAYTAPSNTWVHLAFVSDKTTRLYVNGTLQDTLAQTIPLPLGQLGASTNGAGMLSDRLRATLDEVRVWNVARTEADLASNLRQLLTGAETNLVAYYRFNEAGGIKADDATTNRFDGTLINHPRRVPSYWWPVIKLNSADPLTNECHVPFLDPTTVKATPLAMAAGGYHSLALKGDGTVVGWGRNTQTNGAMAGSNVVAIAAGYSHSLALKADGTVVGWGGDIHGETNGALASSNVVAIAAGDSYSLALKADGTVVGWGDNRYGKANGALAGSNVVAIAAGYSHSLALKADGTVVGWGRYSDGQTNGALAGSNVVAISAGGYHNLALQPDGTVVGWGRNSDGQTNGALAGGNVVAIAAGYSHSLALKADGTVVGWGDNSYGQANGALAGSNVVAIEAGDYHNLALQADGTVVGWGLNSNGQTNVPAGLNTLNLPLAVRGAVDVNVPGTYLLTYSVTNGLGAVGTATRTVVVAPGRPLATTLPGSNLIDDAVTLNGTVYPSGFETTAWFEWGISTGYVSSTEPQSVGYGTSAVAVNGALSGLTPGRIYHYRAVASNSVGVARGADRAFWSPALSLNGSNPLTNECHAPYVDSGVKLTAAPLAIAAGSYHSLALKADGTIVGWGNNTDGQANGALAGSNVVAIAAGDFHSLALKADGTVLGWGNNGSGQTNGTLAGSNVVAIAAGSYHSLALRADGTVVGWGRNGEGEANGALAGSNVVAIAACFFHSLALRADGTVVGWGNNTDGQANGALAGSNVVAIAAGFLHSLALKADGTVVGWGRNNFGQANGALAGSNVVAIAAGDLHSLALKADGTVLGWGNNGSGQTNGTLAGSNVVAIAAGGSPSLALREDGTVIGWGKNDYGQTTIPAGLDTLNLPIAVRGAVDVNVPGIYLLTYSVTNGLGAVGTATRTVVVVAETPRPVFAGWSVAASGQFQLHGTGTPGETYTLQTSTNLVDWVNHTNLVADPGGWIECMDEMEGHAPACFYRLTRP